MHHFLEQMSSLVAFLPELFLWVGGHVVCHTRVAAPYFPIFPICLLNPFARPPWLNSPHNVHVLFQVCIIFKQSRSSRFTVFRKYSIKLCPPFLLWSRPIFVAEKKRVWLWWLQSRDTFCWGWLLQSSPFFKDCGFLQALELTNYSIQFLVYVLDLLELPFFVAVVGKSLQKTLLCSMLYCLIYCVCI